MSKHINELLFDEQAITTADVESDIIDAGAENIAEGMRLELQIDVNVAFVAGTGTPTLTFHLQECATEGGSYTDVLVTQAYGVASLTKKSKLIKFGIPTPLKRYFLLLAEIADGTTFTAGKVSAHFINSIY